jgi:deoxyribonuclease V
VERGQNPDLKSEAGLTHPWDLAPRDAVAWQNRLRDRVVAHDDLPERIEHVAGVDVGFEDGGRITRAAVAVLRCPELIPVARAVARLPTAFPYVPGLLSFRELPAVLAAVRQLETPPDLFLCDGQGLAHPRRFGIACHLGVLLDAPSIGVAKTRLCGTFGEPPEPRGAWTPLRERGEVIGAVLRTRRNVKPLFVSIGHRVSLETAVHWVLACTTRFRLPEPTRLAHHLASGGAKG